MRKRTLPVPGKLVLAAVMVASLGMVGVSYAAWTDTLNVTWNATTGLFNMIFAPDEHDSNYSASITDAAGRSADDLDGVTVQLADEGKSAELTFEQGLPLARLREGDLLKISYPLENGNGTFMNIKRYDPDFTKPWKTITMEPEVQSLVLNGQEYSVDESSAEAYAIPLQFEVFQSFSGEPDALAGNLYLRLTDESLERIQQLPQTLEFSAEALEAAKIETAAVNPAIAAAEGQNGILVAYTCSIPIGLDQNQADDGIIRAGEGATGT